MLSCQQLTEIVTDYLEGRMTLGDRLRFQMHLGMCTHCRVHLRQRNLTIETLGDMPAEPLPDDIRDARFSGGKR